MNLKLLISNERKGLCHALQMLCIRHSESLSIYRKNSKNWDTIMLTNIVVKVEWPECIQKGGDGIANSVDPDQTAP